MNIYEKMLAATAKIATVAKNLSVDTGKGKGYKAVSEADVLAAVKPVEEELGIFSFPVARKILDSGEIVNTYTDRNGNTTTKRQMYMRLETTYRFVNVEKPEEYVDVITYGDGVDSQDKGPGKAMTYADKYALLKGYKIRTGDDPDVEASGELQEVKSSKKETINPTEAAALAAMVKPNQREYILEQAGVKDFRELTPEQYVAILKGLEGK